MLNRLICTLFFIIVTTTTHAESIKSIKVDGNNRISDETIIILSEVKIDDKYSKKLLNSSLKNLYNTNFFKDVTVDFDKGVFKIKVFENPIIQTVVINGIKKTSLVDALYKELKLKNRSSFVEYIAKTDLIKITNILKVNGYYLTKIKTSILENDNNTIDLIYDISLGEKAVINNIRFTGNKVFKNRVLKNIIVSEKSYFWKFISQNKFVDASRINLDVKLLTNFFKNKGYYNVKIENTSAQY
jgi:outer membrane protein insertion porin family